MTPEIQHQQPTTRTEKQREASRNNGRKSKGPKSERGKLKSRRNSLRTGFASRGLVLPDTFQAEVTRQLSWKEAGYKPDSPTEYKLLEFITI
jgi:hypothetical protein